MFKLLQVTLKHNTDINVSAFFLNVTTYYSKKIEPVYKNIILFITNSDLLKTKVLKINNTYIRYSILILVFLLKFVIIKLLLLF